MSARKGNRGFSPLIVIAIAVVVVAGIFLLKPKSTTVNTGAPSGTSKETAKPAAQNVTTPIQIVGSGPVGRNGLRAYAGPGVGQITLEWQRFAVDGENYSIHYGTATNQYPNVLSHVGYIATYTVKNLTPGTKYYFVLEGFRSGNVSAGWDGEVSMVAPSGPVTVIGTAGPVGRNMLVGKPGPKSGQVTLSWVRFFPDTEKYSIVYGILPGVYTFGYLNAIDTTPQDNNYSFVISSLTPGKRYYFALDPQRSGTGIYITAEISVVAP